MNPNSHTFDIPPRKTTGSSFCPKQILSCALSSIFLATSALGSAAQTIEATAASVRLPSDIPVIGAWFPQQDVMDQTEGYKQFLDTAAVHSHYTLLTTTMRDRNRQLTQASVHDWFKRGTIHAKARGMGVALELDARHSINAYTAQYPNALQQRLFLKEFDLSEAGTVVANITYNQNHGDAIIAPGVTGIQLARVFSYQRTAAGAQAGTVQDITSRCLAGSPGSNNIPVTLPAVVPGEGHKACVIVRVTLAYPDVFSPELLQFEAATVQQYADLPLAGLMKDEWGFPAEHEGNISKNAFWTSTPREADYATRTGRNLVRDSLLMFIGEEGRTSDRQAAINDFMEQSTRRNSEVENAVYTQCKATFGPNSFVGTHDTVFPYPDAREFERNGLNWWTATRDFGQTDETTPYSCRTSLTKKCGKPIWFNQWYSSTIESYQKKIWSYALTGGRMNFHVLWPLPTVKEGAEAIMRSNVIAADSRIRLLNNISDAPLDCPVAVVFGHAGVMNWAGPSFEEIGTELTDAFWRAGIYADLIPTSEITNQSLRTDANGEVWYGKQRYKAVILYQPEFENASTATFFQNANSGSALLRRVGAWTKNFDAQPLNGAALLPARMTLSASINACASDVIAALTAAGIQAQTPSSGDYPLWEGRGKTSIDMPAAGRSRLTDGTVILVAGENNRTGDPIQQTLQVNGHEVIIDAVGIAAVRLAADGTLEALAAGKLKRFKAGSVDITLNPPIDLAVWKDTNGTMQGVLQGYTGPVPSALMAIHPNWQRVAVPTLLGATVDPGPQVVLNPSFEDDLRTDGAYLGTLSSWTPVGSGDTGYAAYNPLATDFTGAAENGTPTGGAGAHGINVFSSYVPTNGQHSGVSQEIPASQLTAGVSYTLTVAVGDYKGLTPTNWHLAISTASMNFGSYLADFAGTTAMLTNDQFKNFSIQYTATGDEAQIGSNLKITLWAKNDGSGTHVPFDNVRFTTAAPSSSSDFKATITPNAVTPGNYDFSWNSQTGKVYDLVSSPDLATAPATWLVWLEQAGILANPPTNTLYNVPGSNEAKRFFSVRERDL